MEPSKENFFRAKCSSEVAQQQSLHRVLAATSIQGLLKNHNKGVGTKQYLFLHMAPQTVGSSENIKATTELPASTYSTENAYHEYLQRV